MILNIRIDYECRPLCDKKMKCDKKNMMSDFYIFFTIFIGVNQSKYNVLYIILNIILYEFRICTYSYTLLPYFLRNLSIVWKKK